MSPTTFDESRFRLSVDEVRRARGLSWRQVAREAGMNTSTVCRFGQGKRLSTKSLMRLRVWAGFPGDTFISRDQRDLDLQVEVWSLIRQLEACLGRLPQDRRVGRARDHLDECRMWLEELESDEWEADDGSTVVERRALVEGWDY